MGNCLAVNNTANQPARYNHKQLNDTGTLEEINEAVVQARKAIERAAERDEEPQGYLNDLGVLLMVRYKRTGELNDLEDAICAMKVIIELDSDDWESHPFFMNLGTMLQKRHQRTGAKDDLEEAIRLMRKAVKESVDSPGRHADYLDGLGTSLELRYENSGDLRDIEEAVEVSKQALNSAPKTSDRARILTNLGNNLESRCERTGKLEYLEEAIRVAQEAVDLTPEGVLPRVTRLYNLGGKLFNRYEWTGQMHDLKQAIEVTRLAVEAAPKDYAGMSLILGDLGVGLQSRYNRSKVPQDLEEAIQLSRKAVELTPNDHMILSDQLGKLGTCLSKRYESTRELHELMEAVEVTRQAVATTPLDSPNRAAPWLSKLGKNLSLLAEHTGQMHHLDEAIRVAQLAIEKTSEDHPNYTFFSNNLGDHLHLRFVQTGEISDLKIACDAFLQAWGCLSGRPLDRAYAAAIPLLLLPKLGRVDEAAQLAKKAVNLLVLLSNKSLEREDRQYVLSLSPGVAAEACALLLEVNEPEEATQYLELGRAVILGQLMDDRSDISELKQHYPQYASTYESLRVEMIEPLRHSDLATVHPPIRRQAAVRELESCIEGIRRLPNFDRFQAGQTTEEILHCAKEGEIVIVNVAKLRSDAIIISEKEIKVLSLPNLFEEEAEQWTQKEWIGPKSELAKRNKQYLLYMSWLWDTCVNPVLQEIEATSSGPARDLPRIWWIGTGPASSMPFHAAGRYTSESVENSSCRVVSSYTPSIRSLAYARDRKANSGTSRGNFILTTMPTTPGMSNLPGVTGERNEVLGMLVDSMRPIQLEGPDATEVLEHLKGCRIAHFACHGYIDVVDPSNSGLVLRKHIKDSRRPGQDIMTVRDISQATLEHAQIAYLSACSTVENKVAQLANEVIHVGSGFQVAGFRHVIGCLWPSLDNICSAVAAGFYASLFRHGSMQWDDKDVAVALQESVLIVRARYPRQPLLWAPFVHYGA